MSEFLWRKQVMPFGDIDYKGRCVAFTREYLAGIASAFDGKAFDVVPLQDEAPKWGITANPTLCLGEVRVLEVVDDGMDALVAVGAETDERLTSLRAAGLDLAVAARLVENYRSSDRPSFPVAMMSLHITHSPILAGLRPWTRESANPATGDSDAT